MKVTTIQRIYAQLEGENPVGIENVSSEEIETEDDIYQCFHRANGKDHIQLETGWINNPGKVNISNKSEETILVAQDYIHIASIGPRENLIFRPIDTGNISFIVENDEATKCPIEVTVFPQ